MIEQAFDEISGTGETVTLENTIEARFKKAALPGGNSEQDGEPSPSNPVETQNVSGDVNVTIDDTGTSSKELWLDLGGKNLYSGHTKGIGLNNTTGAEITSANSATTDYIPVDFSKNPKYTISGMPNTLSNYIAAYNSSKQFLGRTGAGSSVKRTMSASSFTSGTAQGSGDIAYLRNTVYKGTNDSGTIDDIDNAQIQLEVGENASAHYSPYIENSIELCKAGNYKDYLYKNNDKWYKHQEVGKIVLDGSNDEDWSLSKTGTENFFYKFRYVSDRVAATSSFIGDLCNRFQWKNVSSDNTNEGFYFLANGELRIRFGTEMTVANLRAWLAENPLIVQYPLAQPVEIEITNTHQIEQLEAIAKATSYKGTTHIYSTNELSPIFDVVALGKEQ